MKNKSTYMKANKFKKCLMSFAIALTIIAGLSTKELSAQANFESYVTNVGKGNSISINSPSGINNGDLLVIGIMLEKGNSVMLTPPTGWTLIRRTDNGTNAGMATYYRIAGNSEPSNYTFGATNNSKWSIGITHYSNITLPGTIEVMSSGNTGNSGNAVANSINTTVNNQIVLCFYTNKKDATYTPASGTTEIYDAPNVAEGQPSNMLAYFVQSSAGSTSDMTAVPSESERWVAQQVGFNFLYTNLTMLPVDLVYFRVVMTSIKAVNLSWATASELNNSHFEIERSKDGNDWMTLGIVQGAGNSDELNTYDFTDMNPMTGINYYRLKQVDFNGDVYYSNLREVMMNKIVSDKVNVYPNPAVNFVNIDVPPTVESVKTEIRTVDGRVVLSETHNNISKASVSIAHLTPGVYYMHIQMGDQTFIKTIIKN